MGPTLTVRGDSTAFQVSVMEVQQAQSLPLRHEFVDVRLLRSPPASSAGMTVGFRV